MTDTDSRHAATPYQLFMVALSTFVLLSLGVRTVWRLDPGVTLILDRADTAICVVFF